jgi:hypothetical protein
MDVWSEGGRRIQKRAVENQSFLHVVEGIFKDCDSDVIKLFVGVARRLWLRRNPLIHEGIFVPPAVLMKQSSDAVEDYRKANEMDHSKNANGQNQWMGGSSVGLGGSTLGCSN